MPKPKRGPAKAANRPQKEIDWNLVDKLLEAGCIGTEIAPYFDMHPDTLYLRCSKEKDMTFTAYSYEKRSKGDSNIRMAQYFKALGLSENGDNTLLIWLGKNRLNQKETPNEVSIDDKTVKSFGALMEQIAHLQKRV